jgi:uncharacterized protein (DUF1778 family)
MGTASGNDARVSLRIDAASKKRLERAAAVSGTTLSDFIVTGALAAANEVLAAHEASTLSPRDWNAFFGALTDPAPSPSLQRALRRHDRLYGE